MAENEALKALVTNAIMATLTEQTREELLKKAITTLITEERVGYNNKLRSPLSDAFDQAMGMMAREIVIELVKTDEIRARLRSIAQKAFDLMALNEEKIASRMADAMTTAMTSRD